MPLMTKIHANLPKVVMIGVAVVFSVLIVFDWGMDLPGMRNPGGAGEVIGTVNGRDIKYREFAEMVQRVIDNNKAQTGGDIDEETERQIRAQVWNELVTQILVEQEIDRLNIDVTDQEIVEIAHGANPPEFVVSQFRDSLGVFNRSAYDRALADPQNSAAWLQVEEVMRRQRKNEKLTSAIFASLRVTEGEAKQRFIDQTTSMEVEYVLFDPNRLVSDSLAEISDKDIKSYYDENQEEFKVRPARRLKYVLFPLAPSAEDTMEVRNEMIRLREEARGMSFSDLAKTYSEIPPTEAFFKHGELSKPKENGIFAARKGDIVGPILDQDGYHLVQILDERTGSAEFVRASHILFAAGTGSDSLRKLQQARDVLRQIRGGADFATLAREQSDDGGSAHLGGDLGWTGRNGWVKPFEQAAFGARVGEVVGPIRTQFGWHLIKVVGKDRREMKIVNLTLKIKSSSQTIDVISQRTDDFAYLAKEEGFEAAANNSGYEVRETPEFTKGGVVPGVGFNESLSNFAFTKSEGTISQPMTVGNSLGVFVVSAVREEGFRPLEEVKGIVRSQAVRKKKNKLLKERIDGFAQRLQKESDLIREAQAIPNLQAQRTPPFRPAEGVPGIGRDGAFIGTAMRLDRGEISQPFEGLRGHYVMKLVARTEFDSVRYHAERESLRLQLLTEKRNRFTSEWLASLRERAEIEDKRDVFYR